jgi:hypothetical protein
MVLFETLFYLERAKKIYDYEIIIVFKYDIVIRFTLVPSLDGNRAVVSFLSLYNVVVGNALLLEGKLVGTSFSQWNNQNDAIYVLAISLFK